jgi:pyruvate kinase
VSDVANAIFDGSSAVMLSAETAAGDDPVAAVAAMARISERADAEFDYEGWATKLRLLRQGAVGDGDAAITDAMTGAAWRAATELGASAIIGISESGFTVRSIARFRPQMPILAFSPNDRTVRQLTLSWGTTPLAAPAAADSLEMIESLVTSARDQGYVRSGDLVAVLAGAGSGIHQATDLLRLVRVP